MEITCYSKGLTVKTMLVTDAAEATDEDVLDFACAYAGEVWRGPGHTLFGYRVQWTSTRTAAVTLDTD